MHRPFVTALPSVMVISAYVRGLSPESRYNRFFGALQELAPAELERVTHLDRRYDLARVAETDGGRHRS
jgi:hypothetical protein